MRYAVFAVLAMLLLSGACFAQLTEQRRACVRACCENSGGTYDAEQNGCEEPGEGEFECSINCANEPKKETCPSAILMAGLIGGAFYLSRR